MPTPGPFLRCRCRYEAKAGAYQGAKRRQRRGARSAVGMQRAAAGTNLNLVTSGRFRFGVVATPQTAVEDIAGNWQRQARRAEELGYSSVLMPDGMQLPSPMPTLALAAVATTALRVGTFVLASPLRPPALAAWEAHSMSMLTGGRFEFGIGTGHPGNVRQAVEVIGMPETTAAQRLDPGRAVHRPAARARRRPAHACADGSSGAQGASRRGG